MSVLNSVLIIEYDVLRLVLYSDKNGRSCYFSEKKLPYDGFTESGFKNPEDVFSKIQSLYETGQNEFGAIAGKSSVIIPGIFYKFKVDESEVAVHDGTVTNKEIQDVISDCGVRLPGYEIAEITPIVYKTYDGATHINPLGQKTERLYLAASVGYLKLGIKEIFDNVSRRVGIKFAYSSFCATVSRAEGTVNAEKERVIIIISEGHIDVVHCFGNAPVLSISELYGAKTVIEATADALDVDLKTATEIIRDINLNLSETDDGKYFVSGEGYSVQTVNSVIKEMVNYYAILIAKCVSDMDIGEETQIYLTGSDICSVRGVREMLEKKIGQDIEILYPQKLNMIGCGNYIAASAIDCTDKGQSVFKDLLGKLTKWRKK